MTPRYDISTSIDTPIVIQNAQKMKDVALSPHREQQDIVGDEEVESRCACDARNPIMQIVTKTSRAKSEDRL